MTSVASPGAAPKAFVALRKRSDFLHAARARRFAADGFLLQARNRNDDDPSVRVGFTCSKKVGNAVARNRAKRRLRALAHEVLRTVAQPGWDYVLVGRRQMTASLPYQSLCRALMRAVERVHR